MRLFIIFAVGIILYSGLALPLGLPLLSQILGLR